MAVTVQQFRKWKQQQRPITVLTAWDYAIAQLLDQAGIDIILVGDSLGMVALGYPNTLPVTLEEMIHHTRAVCRGVERAFVVCDLPFLTYQESTEQAIHSAGRILKETGANAVKMEGGNSFIIDAMIRLTKIGIPVMGHVGLTPQSVHQLGYKQQGKTPQEAERIIQEAIAIAQAGAFALVLEHMPADLATLITQKVAIPTIGIGAGSGCDGQVLVTADLLGLSAKIPPFAKKYADLQTTIREATQAYIAEIKAGQFPSVEQ
jgi:3-methyl-2-oxobutanoate hydroxymethyltransferase